MTNALSSRGHWRARKKATDRWKRLVIDAVVLSRVKPPNLTKAKITCIRHTSREPDFDGLVSGFKHCIDTLKVMGIIIDDRPSVIGYPTYLFQKTGRGKGFIEIIVEGVPECPIT